MPSGPNWSSEIAAKLSEFPPSDNAPHAWYLALHPHAGEIPPLGEGSVGLVFKEGVSQKEAEDFEKLFDRLIGRMFFQVI